MRFWIRISFLFVAVLAAPGACAQPAATVPGDSRLQIPATDDGLPGAGPIRRYDWFRKLWLERRSAWAQRVQQDQKALVFLGDSITQGWGDGMGGSFAGIKVANRGISGDTTRGVLIRLDDDVLSLNPSGIVLLIGTNDLEEGADPETIAANLKLILAKLKAHNPKMPVILCQVFPSSASRKRPAAKIKQLNQLYAAAVKGDPQVTLLETWPIFANAEGDARPEEFPDLLHPNQAGYAKWAEALRPALAAAGIREKEVRLYEGRAPGSEDWKRSERESRTNVWRTRIVYNVTDPTVTIFPADPAKASGAALVICPGGGFFALSIDSEGNDVARWLADKGVACFVLKYRLHQCSTDDPIQELMAKGPGLAEAVKPIAKLALADGQAAIRYVRQHAQEYGVNSDRIGIMGFSAGGTVATSVAYNYAPESRPAFAAPIYPAYDWAIKAGVPGDAPPMFILAASDDQLGLAPNSVALYTDWTVAGKSAELHLLAKGGHGFGMRKQNRPSDRWIELF